MKKKLWKQGSSNGYVTWFRVPWGTLGCSFDTGSQLSTKLGCQVSLWTELFYNL